MRLGRLDLIRYGHFSDRSFNLPAGESDFHIIFGPNEAGKSTALTAIEDLLFGIDSRSPYNFLHDYASMRVGGVLENGHGSLEVVRRKGNKDTLLGPEGSPLPGGDGVLAPYLAGGDRPFFERMFSLDHIRLETGGREILEAKDDVGQMLFSAGAGIAGLRERLKELSAEADDLWSARRAKHRKFYIADDKLSEAQKALRDQTLTATKWRELKRAFDDTEEACAAIGEKIRDATAERNRLSRIRRVFRDVRRKQELDCMLSDLSHVVLLPEDAAQTVANAQSSDSKSEARRATLREQLDRAAQELDGLAFDETLVQRGEDVRQLHERRIEIRGEKADLPKRQAELTAAEEKLRADAKELGWTETESAALIDRIPSRTGVGVVRSLLAKRGEIDAGLISHAQLLREAQEAADEAKGRLDEAADPADTSKLALVLKTVREQGDLAGGARAAEKTFREAAALVERRLNALKPGGADEDALAALAVPARADVQVYRDREQDQKRRLRDAQQSVSSTRQEMERATAAFDRTVRDEQLVTPEELQHARSRRDSLWHLVKLRHIEGGPVPDDQEKTFADELDDLPGAFEPALGRADDLADRRFEHAEAAGRLAEIRRKIGEQEILLQQAQANESALVEEGEALGAEWRLMWKAAPFEPLSAEAMLEWLPACEDVLEAIQHREQQKDDLDDLRSRVGEARERLLAELTALGIDANDLKEESLSLILQRADQAQRAQEAAAQKKSQVEDELAAATKLAGKRGRDLKNAEDALEKWQESWMAALKELGLAENTAAEAVGTQLDIIDNMRGAADKISSLRYDRIEKITRDVADFEQVVAKLLQDVAGDLSGQAAEDAILALEARLDAAERKRDLRSKKISDIERFTSQIDDLDDERRELAASISHLERAAGVETVEALNKAIGQSDRKRAHERELQDLVEKLLEDGDGKSIEELAEECEGVSMDEIAAREASLQAEFDDLQDQQTQAAEVRSQARDAFQAIGGGDEAAQAAASRQEALADMEEIAARYVRVRTSAVLLQWAIDRYRREKQTPLLKRAGELFKIMTGGSFAGLQVAFDEQDAAHLTGVRGGDTAVPVSRMSTGTADQLYLALRIAAIEDYLERADALPFVADDLFINFDDERAAAGFTLLAELSRKTQVLFFTHHQHLVELARANLDSGLNVVRLSDHTAAAA
ncbi:ATP-binding protein [Pacificimonas flava]|uniref:DNA double-strand break repair Rad50 ATPase n=1 Tax=Pacificimonas flava TaxID=1234595 RepID=M2TJU3_9SPHN|nr:YhaN family protein [Pacificimonas flava]EMD81921.1 DNA double-strand break repair Rad50 ATPase [Pacificimonas flava]MBB5281547.1 uncharacterized protein YhaN [Pacificimonas flava]